MGAANVNVTVTELAPLGGATNAGLKIGLLKTATKAAANDTLTVTNAAAISYAILTIDADGTEEAVTIATNIITLTDSTTGTVSGLVIYR
jgi:hypothetical protein